MKSANFPWICLWKSCEIWLFFPQPTRSPEKSSCLTNKCENIFDVVTRSVWTLMSVSMYELWTRFLVVFYPGFQIKVFFSKQSGSNVTGQLRSQSRHCALTSHYFKLCPLHKSVLSQMLLLFHFFTAVHVSSQRTYENLFLVHRFVVLVLEALYPQHFVFFTSCLH